MTAIDLLNQMKSFIEENIKDIILQVKSVKNKTTPEYQESDGEQITHRAPEIHLMKLPDKNAETQRIPYVILQFLTGVDSQASGEPPESDGNVRIIVATYSEDGGEGSMDLLNVITRIRIALLKEGQVGQFLLRKPLEYIIYPDNVNPYYLGEIMTVWELPEIYREVNLHG